ncbi:MAG TPA: M28 family peptidase [Gemmatimonadales bacterium]
MTRFIVAGPLLFAALSIAPLSAQQRCPVADHAPLPLKYSGAPTVAAITPCDLMTRLYQFSDDSMQGREVGTEGHLRATAWIERQARQLGLKPAGDSGTYFQNIPVVMRTFDTASTVTVAGTTWHTDDFVAQTPGAQHQFANTPTIFVGKLLDTTAIVPVDQARGKVLIFLPPDQGVDADAIEATAAFQRWYLMYQSGAGRVIIAGYQLPDGILKASMTEGSLSFTGDEQPVELVTTVRLAEAMLGTPLGSAIKGALGKTVTSDVRFHDEPRPGRNVVAILPGSDPLLRNEYVAIGAHNDHLGIADSAVDHDSLRLYNAIARPEGADGGASKPLTVPQWAQLHLALDSLHKLHGGARRDSILNGADDDGSGSVSVLEIAQAFALGPLKPKRSILFIWHAGEEKGLWGSEYFTDHPTVPRDSIVAELNMDMVGRGQPADVTGTTKDGQIIHGSSNYLQIIGSRRLSTELGDLVESVNREAGLGITFDYALDADGHPEDIYCRSDHAEYARYGIPIAFFTTGGHEDYHQVTDEAQYIDYSHMATVDQLVFDVALKVANLAHRVVVDHPKPDPHGVCQQ